MGRHAKKAERIPRANERNDAHEAENLVCPGPLAEVDETAAEAARKALKDSDPGPI